MKKKNILIVCISIVFCSVALYGSEDNKDIDNSTAVNETVHPTSQKTERGLYLDSKIALQYNYLGLEVTANLFYRIPFIKKPGILFETTKIDVGIQELWTPSYNRTSFYLMIEPLAVFDVVFIAGYDYLFTELYGGIYKFDNKDADFDDKSLEKMEDTSGGGFRMTVTPTFKVEFKGVAALYSFTADYHVYNFKSYYYDQATFLIHKGNDILLQHDATLMYLIEPIMLRVGVRFVDKRVEGSKQESMSFMGMLLWTPIFKSVPQGSYPYFALLGGSYFIDKYYKNDPYIAILAGFTYKIF